MYLESLTISLWFSCFHELKTNFDELKINPRFSHGEFRRIPYLLMSNDMSNDIFPAYSLKFKTILDF